MLFVRGEQQEVGKEGQTIDDLRIIKNKSFVEFGTNEMSEFAQACRNYGMEDLFFAALKMKPKSKEPKKNDVKVPQKSGKKNGSKKHTSKRR